jgi:hypothetical protein
LIKKIHLDPENKLMLDNRRDEVMIERQVQNRFDYDVKEKWKAHLKEERTAYCLIMIKSNLKRKERLNGCFHPNTVTMNFQKKKRRVNNARSIMEFLWSILCAIETNL